MSIPACKKLHILFLLVVFLSASYCSDAQVPSIPPPPDAASLGKFGDIPVGTYTGTPQIQIPIHELRGRSLTLPITLNYHASGVKVEEISSWIGIGWSLNAGGSITRTINGLSDFKSKDGVIDKYGIARQITYNANGSQITGRRIPMAISSQCVVQWEDGSVDNNSNLAGFISDMVYERYIDTEPDMFYFNFEGLTGKFFFDKNRVIQHDQPVDLEFLNFPDKDSDGWVIRTPDGTIYEFGTENLDSSGSEIESWIEWTRAHYSGEGRLSNLQASSWYLKKIQASSGESINFSYGRYNYEYSMFSAGMGYEYMIDCAPAGAACSPPSSIGSVTKIEAQSLFVQQISISYPDGSSSLIKFVPADDRQDCMVNPGSVPISTYLKRRLSKIQIIEKNSEDEVLIKEYRLMQDTLSNKLWLRSIQEVGLFNGVELSNPYSFDYYKADQFPLRNSKATDLWGYYNGANSNWGYYPDGGYDETGQYHILSTGGDSKNVSEEYSKYGILTRINYPTGGYTKFEYEANSLGNFNVYKRLDNSMAICKVYSSSAPCSGEVPEELAFTVEIPGDFQFNTEIVHPAQDQLAAKVCREYLTTGYATSCDGTSNYSTNFAITGFEKRVRLAYTISGSSASNPANSILIKNGSLIVKEVSISKGYPSVGTLDLNLASGTYQITVNAINVANHKVAAEIVREVYQSPNPTYVIRLYRPDNTYQDFVQSGVRTLSLTAGNYIIKTQQIDRQVSGAKASCTFKQINPVSVLSNRGAGLRVKRITTHDGLDSRNDIVKRYEYSLENGISSGWLMRRPVTVYTSTFVYNGEFGNFCFFRTFGSNSAYPLSTSASGNFVGYSFVTIYNGENGENGKTTFRYSQTGDGMENNDAVANYKCALFDAGGILLPGTPSLSNYFRNGQLIEQIEYKAEATNFIPVKRVLNTYQELFSTTNGLKIMALAKPPRYNTLLEWVPQFPGAPLIYKYYAIRIGLSRLVSSSIITIDDSGRELAMKTDFNYRDDHLVEWKKTTDNMNRDFYTKYSYKENTNLIVEEKTSFYHYTAEPVEGKVIEYDGYFPKRIFYHEPLKDGELPSSETQLGSSPQSNYKLRIKYDYNNYRNLISEERDNMVTSYLWDSKNKDVIAVIRNALPGEVFHTSFEDIEGVADNNTKTGQKLRSSSYTKAISGLSKRNYILSFWKRTNGVWEYVSQKISLSENNYTINIFASETAPVDEIRFSPEDSQMMTYTYLKGRGVHSRSDENGTTEYYEYDPLGRLVLIKDHDKNVIRAFDYNLKDSQN